MNRDDLIQGSELQQLVDDLRDNIFFLGNDTKDPMIIYLKLELHKGCSSKTFRIDVNPHNAKDVEVSLPDVIHENMEMFERYDLKEGLGRAAKAFVEMVKEKVVALLKDVKAAYEYDLKEIGKTTSHEDDKKIKEVCGITKGTLTKLRNEGFTITKLD